jgi:hypothetical protein
MMTDENLVVPDFLRNQENLAEERRQSASASNGWLSTIPDYLKAAAARFNETCEDGEGYDVPAVVMTELARAGLVRWCGRGIYEQTDLMLQLKDDLRRYGR